MACSSINRTDLVKESTSDKETAADVVPSSDPCVVGSGNETTVDVDVQL